MTRRTMPFLVVLAALVCAVAVFAQQPVPPGPGGQRARMGPMGPPAGPGIPFGQLQLTDEQKAQVQAIMAQHRPADPPEMPPLQRKLQQAMFGGDQPDLAAIESIKQEIVAAEARMLDTRIATEMEIAKILTPEQKQRLLDLPPPMGRGGLGPMMGGRGHGGRGVDGAIR